MISHGIDTPGTLAFLALLAEICRSGSQVPSWSAMLNLRAPAVRKLGALRPLERQVFRPFGALEIKPFSFEWHASMTGNSAKAAMFPGVSMRGYARGRHPLEE